MTQQIGPAPVGPRRQLTTTGQVYLSLHWFSLSFHWGALVAIIIPAEILKFVAATDKGRALGATFAGGAAVALLVMPLAGALSDRSLSRFGRRRPFIFAGALLNAAALVALGAAPTLGWFTAAYWLVQLANNLGGSAYSGLIPDRVPPAQRGSASGFMGLMSMLGTLGGSIVAGGLLQRGIRMPLYSLIGALLIATTALTVWKVPDPPQVQRPSSTWREFFGQFWVAPRRHPDFAWLFGSRFLAMMGFYTMVSFLQFFLKDYLHLARYTEATGTLTASVIVGAFCSALIAGRLSDRIGRRGILSGATLLMGLLTSLFALAPSWHLMLTLGVIFGLGYGAFVSVEWALATEVLPSSASVAKDLGIWGIAVTLPQVAAPIIGGPILDGVNRMAANQGYLVLLGMGAAYLAISGLAVWKIRGVR